MIYTSGTTGKPKGALRRNAGDPAQVGGDAAVHRLHARRRLHHDRPAVPLRSRRVHGHRQGARPDRRAAAQVRPGGLAAPACETYRCTSTFSAPTPIRMICNLPADVQGPLRPVVDADHDRQRRAVELRPQAAVRRRLPARLAVRGLRLDRARREHDPAARGPAAQARLVRQGGADGRDPAVRRRRQRGHRHRARGDRRAVRAQRRRCSPTTTSSTTSSRRTTATASRPSATSPTATTRASSTSATARRT